MQAEITTAKTAGFCFGVDRAVKMVYQALDEGKRVATLGPVVHNASVVGDLNAKGARIVETPEALEQGETLIIRAHGVPHRIDEQFHIYRRTKVSEDMEMVFHYTKGYNANVILDRKATQESKKDDEIGICVENDAAVDGNLEDML